MADYTSMRRMAALSPDEEAASVSRETSPASRAELEQAIQAEKDPGKRELLLQLHSRDFNGGGGAAAPRLTMSEFLAGKRGAGSAAAAPAPGPVSLSDFLASMPDAAAAPSAEPSGTLRRAGDLGLSLLQGAIAVPETAVGLADMATGGRVGKALENEGGAVGFRPKQAREYLDTLKTPEQQEADKAVGEAQGFVDTTKQVLTHPSVILHSITQSVPSMLAGGTVGRALLKMAPMVPGAVAGAFGEGVVSAGQTAEQVRQESPGGRLTPGQSALSAASGAFTGLLGVLGGKVAQRLGIHDIDTLVAGKAAPEVTKPFVQRVLGGIVSEGLLEELPQSLQEQVAQNMALGKPLDEGINQAMVLGTLAGAGMGAGAQVFHRTPGDQVRQDKHAEAGPATRAVNAGVELHAKVVDAAAGVIANPPAGAPVMAPDAAPDASMTPGVVDNSATASAPTDAAAPVSPVPATPAAPAETTPELTTPGVSPKESSIPASKVEPDAALARIERDANREASTLAFQRRAAAADETPTRPVPQQDPIPDTGVGPADVMASDGKPFKSRTLADRQARALGKDYAVAIVPGGYVARAVLTAQASAADTKARIDAAAAEAASSPTNDRPEPTDAQKEAGNYKKGHTRISGMGVTIETPKGAVRRGKAGADWEVTMPAHYGYIKGTIGADTVDASRPEQVDLFIGDKGDNGRFWVINQHHAGQPDKFDEHKVVTGVDSADEAVALYKGSFSNGFGEKVFSSISHEHDASGIKAMLPKLAKPKPVKHDAAFSATPTGETHGQETPASSQANAATGAAPVQGGDASNPDAESAAADSTTAGADVRQGAETPVDGQAKVIRARKPMRPHAAIAGSSALGAVSNRLGGISPELLSDLSEKVQRTQTSKSGKTATYTAWKNPPHAGRGPLFRKGGSADLSEIARVLEEEGYIEPGHPNPESRAQEIIKAELAKGGSTLRIGDTDAVEAEARRRMDAANEAPDPTDGLSHHDLDALGYADASDVVRTLTDQLLAQAEAAGLDTEALRDDAARQTEGETQTVYHGRLQDLVADAIRANRAAAAKGDTAGPPAGSEARRGDAGAQGAAAGQRPDRPDAAVRAAEPEPVSGYNAADLKAKTEREAKATELDQKAQVDREAAGFNLEQQAVESRKDNTGDLFGGPSAADVQAAKPPGKQKPVDVAQHTLFEPQPTYGNTPHEPFYSELGRQAIKAPMRSAPAQGWSDWLKGLVAKGTVKADEIEWSGINEWLALQEGARITNAQVQAFLAENGVKVGEVVLGDMPQDTKSMYDQAIDNLTQEYRLWKAENNLNHLGSADEHLGDPSLTDAQRTWLKDFSSRWDDTQDEFNVNPNEDDYDDSPGTPKYSRYTLPGGKGYRELLLTLPRMPGKQGVLRKAVFDKYNPQIQALADEQVKAVSAGARDTALINRLGDEQQALRIQRDAEAAAAAGEMPEYKSGHWAPHTNVLAHLRFNERLDAEGKRVLFIEEIQSDWAQQGKKHGFLGTGAQPSANRDQAYQAARDALARNDDLGFDSHMQALTAIRQHHDWRERWDVPAADAALIAAYIALPPMANVPRQVPTAPFVGKTDAWVALAIKRAIKWGVDNGFDRVAFVNGQQSADRYSLEKHVSKVRWYDASVKRRNELDLNAPEGSGSLMAYDLNDTLIIDKQMNAADLADHVGKEVAERLLAAPAKAYDGTNGMRGHQRERELSGLELKVGGEGMKAFYDQIVPKVAKEVLRKVGGGALSKVVLDTSGANNMGPGWEHLGNPQPQLGFDITPAMRESARAGVAVFEERAVYNVRESDKNYDLPFDLFDLTPTEQAPQTGNRAARRKAAAAEKKAPAPQANTLAVRQDPALPGLYHVSSQLVEVGRRDLPVSRVTSWESAAAALASLSNWAVEHFDMLITDKDGKPLAIVGSFKGALAQTSIYPGTLLMEALRIEGAASAWSVHNHPSGDTTLSRADEHLSGTLQSMFDSTTIKFMGIAAVGQNEGQHRFTAMDRDGDRYSGDINIEGAKTTSVPIVNRTLTTGKMGVSISDPRGAKAAVAAISNGNSGIVFLDNQHRVSAWVPLDPKEGNKLMFGTGFEKLINSAAEAGAGGAMLVNPTRFGERLVEQLRARLAQVDVRMLDAIDTDTGVSWAEHGLMEPEKGYTVQRVEANEPMRSALASAIDRIHNAKLPAGYIVADLLDRHGKISWWDKTIGTPFHLAQRYPAFKRVYDAVQNFLNDVSFYATESANLAPRILPKLETWKDLIKQPLSAAATKAIAAPIFEGTLNWARGPDGKPVKVGDLQSAADEMSIHDKAHALFRDGHLTEGEFKRWRNLPIESYEGAVRNRYDDRYLRAGIVWTDAELKSMFGLTEGDKGTIGLYKEFRTAVDKSLADLGISDMLRLAGDDAGAELRDQAMAAAGKDETEAQRVDRVGVLLRDHFYALAKTDEARASVHNDTGDRMIEKADRAKQLMKEGYAPLSRFGTYTLDIVDAEGERLYFGMFETPKERARMARQMKANYPDGIQTVGTMSEEMFKNFAGVSPETLELFGDMLGLEAQGNDPASQAFQTWLKVVKANRSAMKRLIHRKGIAGFSEDAGRVLAGFVYSNARQTSSNLHMKEAKQAVIDIPKAQGELGTSATRLLAYVQNPAEEAHKIKAVLFTQYLGGSIAAAMVNMTQPLAVTFPYLSRWGGAGKAAMTMRAAIADAMKASTGDAALDKALKHAEEEGIVSPQEVHQLLAQSMGRATLRSGDGTAAGNAAAKTANFFSKVSLGWGKVFSLAEQANRRITFIAAYRTAVANAMPNPAKFAAEAIAHTQFTYNKGNKPEWARGAVGSVLMTFKQYSISYLELLYRTWSQGGPEGKRAALLMLAVLFLMGGSDGLPFADDASDVIDGVLQHLGYNFSSHVAKQEFFANLLGKDMGRFMEKGISGMPGVPIDVSGRLGMGNLIPGSGLLAKKADHTSDVAELAGPAGDLAKRAFQAAGLVAQGEVARAHALLSPKAAQNIAQAIEMASTGMYKDQAGKKVLDVDGFDALMKGIGFQPNSVARVQESKRDIAQFIALNKIRETELADKWARGVFEKDPAKVQEAKDDLAAWNARNPESRIVINNAQIRKRVNQMNMPAIERVAKTAPKEIRAQVKAELEAAR